MPQRCAALSAVVARLLPVPVGDNSPHESLRRIVFQP